MIRCRGAILVSRLGVTLCSTFCSGWVTMGTLCRSPQDKSHLWVWLVSVLFVGFGASIANLLLILSRTLDLFGTGNSFNVVMFLSVNSWRCLFHIRNSPCQCWGNNYAEPDIRYARVSGMKNMVASVVVQRWTNAPCIDASATPQTLHFWGFVHCCFATWWGQWEAIPIIGVVDGLIRGAIRVDVRCAHHVQCAINLGH